MAFDKRRSLQNALTYTQQAKWDKAIQEYQAILRVDPKDVTVCNNLGDLYARAGKLADAIDQYLKLGELYRADGLAVKAIAVYKKIAKLDPGQVATYLACAELYLEQGLVGEAKIQLQAAAELFAKDGDLARLIETDRRLAELDPANVSLLVKLADLLLKQGKGEEAAVEYERAAQAAQAAGQTADAQRLLKKARELAPQLAGPSLVDAEGLVREGKFEQAAAALAKLTADEPGNAEAWRLLGEARTGAGQGAEALAAFQRGVELGVAEETLLPSMARAMALAGQGAEAVELCERVTEEALNRGEPDDAVNFCREVAAGELPAVEVRHYLTTLLINLGRDEEARAEGMTLAAVHQRAGNPAAAIQVYRWLLDRNPEDAEVKRLLGPLEPGGAPEVPELSLSLGEPAVPEAAAPAPPPAGPEITLEGFEDLSTLLGSGLPTGEVEEHPEGAFSASGAGAGAGAGKASVEPTIEFVLPEEEPTPPAAAESPGLEPEGPTAPPPAEGEIDLGDFAALLAEPEETPPAESGPAPWLAGTLEGLSLNLPGEEEPAPETEAAAVPVIELTPEPEPIVFPAEPAPSLPAESAIPVLELPEETPAVELPSEAPAPTESAGEPSGLSWLEIPSLSDESAELPGPPPPAAGVEAAPPAAPAEGDEAIAEQLTEAEVYLRYGLEDKARERLLEAVRLAPASLPPRLKLKAISLERGERAEACQQILGIVDLLEARGAGAEALAEIREGLALIPDHPELLERLRARGEGMEPPPAEAAPAEPLELLVEPAIEEAAPAEEATPPVEPLPEPLETIGLPPLEIPAPEAPPAEPAPIGVILPEPSSVELPSLEFPPLEPPPAEPAPVEAASLELPPLEFPPLEPTPPEEPAPPREDSATVFLGAPPAAPPAEEEIPIELQALLEPPEAGPTLLPEGGRSERDQALADDLAEAEFYLAQGMVDEARAVYRRLQSLHPGHPAVVELGGRLPTGAPPAPEPAPRPAPPAPPAPAGVSLQDVIPTFTIAEDLPTSGTGIPGSFVDLGAELAEELEQEDRSEEQESPLVEGLLREFKRGVREQVDDKDYETHYNLGVAYKDMELYDEAIEELRLASRGVQRALECAELLGRCFLAKGEVEEAVRHLRGGLEVGGHPREAYHGLRYTLAQAYETAGETERALEQLEVIQAEDPHFRDVTARLQGFQAGRLPRAEGAPPAPPAAPAPAPKGRGKKKISFI